jgi:hypothetical protein
MANLQDLYNRMADLGTTPPNKTLTLGIYGKPGTGKTVLAVGLAKYIIPADKRVLYIDTREGWVSLQNHPKFLPGVSRVEMTSFEDFGLMIQGMARGEIKDIGAVILDEGTTAADMLLNELQHNDLGRPMSEIITEKPDWTYYRTVGDSLVQVITAFQQLHIHFIIVSHEKTKDDSTGKSVTKPGYSDTINDKVQRLLHVSARLTTQIASVGPQGTVYERVVQSHPSVLVDAKSRIGNLPVTTDPGSFTQVIHDWIFDSSRGFAPEAQTVAADPLPAEAAPPTPRAPDSEPTMGEM